MKTATVSVSDKIRMLDRQQAGLTAGVIAKRLGCTVNLVYQVRQADAKKAARERSQKTAAAAKQSLAICDVPKADNGNGTPLDQKKISRVLGSTMEMLKRVPTIGSSPQDLRLNPPAICEPADIVQRDAARAECERLRNNARRVLEHHKLLDPLQECVDPVFALGVMAGRFVVERDIALARAEAAEAVLQGETEAHRAAAPSPLPAFDIKVLIQKMQAEHATFSGPRNGWSYNDVAALLNWATAEASVDAKRTAWNRAHDAMIAAERTLGP